MSDLISREGSLIPRAPFDFQKTLQFVMDFTATKDEQKIEPDSLTKALTLNSRAVAFRLRDTGKSVEEPQLTYTLLTEQPLTDEEHETIRDRISFFLSLNDDLNDFYRIGRADPRFAPVIDTLYGLHQPKFLTPFEIACWSVLTQRNPIAIARRRKQEISTTWGTRIVLPEGTYLAFPEPHRLASLSVDELIALVRNARKAEYLLAVAQFFSEVDEHYLRTGDYNEVATKIRSIRGIGEWSAHFILIRGLGRTEQTVFSNKEILSASSIVYQQEMTPAGLQRIGEAYGRNQGYWTFYMRAGTFLSSQRPASALEDM